MVFSAITVLSSHSRPSVRIGPWLHGTSQVAIEISGLISRGILRPGDRIPSVRKACQQYRANAGTMLQAYGELETRELIFARPQSGYYVRAQEKRRAPEPAISSPRNGSTRVDIASLVFEVLATIKDREIVPLGSAFRVRSCFLSTS